MYVPHMQVMPAGAFIMKSDQHKSKKLRKAKAKAKPGSDADHRPKKKKTKRGKAKTKQSKDKMGGTRSMKRRGVLKRHSRSFVADEEPAEALAAVPEDAEVEEAWPEPGKASKGRKKAMAKPKAKAKGKAKATAKAKGKAKATPKRKCAAKAKCKAKAKHAPKCKASPKANGGAKAKAGGKKRKDVVPSREEACQAFGLGPGSGNINLDEELCHHLTDAVRPWIGSTFSKNVKDEIRDSLPKLVNSRLNIYWTRSAVSLTIDQKKDLFSTSFSSDGGSDEGIPMLLAIFAASLLAPCQIGSGFTLNMYICV